MSTPSPPPQANDDPAIAYTDSPTEVVTARVSSYKKVSDSPILTSGGQGEDGVTPPPPPTPPPSAQYIEEQRRLHDGGKGDLKVDAGRVQSAISNMKTHSTPERAAPSQPTPLAINTFNTSVSSDQGGETSPRRSQASWLDREEAAEAERAQAERTAMSAAAGSFEKSVHNLEVLCGECGAIMNVPIATSPGKGVTAELACVRCRAELQVRLRPSTSGDSPGHRGKKYSVFGRAAKPKGPVDVAYPPNPEAPLSSLDDVLAVIQHSPARLRLSPRASSLAREPGATGSVGLGPLLSGSQFSLSSGDGAEGEEALAAGREAFAALLVPIAFDADQRFGLKLHWETADEGAADGHADGNGEAGGVGVVRVQAVVAGGQAEQLGVVLGSELVRINSTEVRAAPHHRPRRSLTLAVEHACSSRDLCGSHTRTRDPDCSRTPRRRAPSRASPPCHPPNPNPTPTVRSPRCVLSRRRRFMGCSPSAPRPSTCSRQS